MAAYDPRLVALGVTAAIAVETSRAEAAEALALPLAGGTMSGAIAMGSHKVTGLTNGSASSDAAAFGQIPTSASSIGGMLTATYDAAAIAQQVVGTTATQTVTNKRITRRVVTVTQSATPAINTDNTDIASITALAQAITSMTSGLSGTPVDGDSLIIRLTDNGTARAITWGTSFEASTVALPTTTVISTLLTVGFWWNAVTSKWRCSAVA